MAGFFGIAGPPLRRLGTYAGQPPSTQNGNQLRRWIVMQILEDEERDRLKAAAKAEKQAVRIVERAAKKRLVTRPREETVEEPHEVDVHAEALLRQARQLRERVVQSTRMRPLLRDIPIAALPVIPSISFVRRMNPKLADDIRPILVDLANEVETRKRRQRVEEEFLLFAMMEVLQ